MPFEVFRRHQRKLLAFFAIMAMFGFVVSDSLPRLLNSNTGGRDQKVAELYGKSVYQSQLNDLARQRNRANLFVSSLGQFMSREVFGGLKQRDMVDAMILQHEADRLNIPATADIGKEWLKQITGGRMNAELFNILFSRFSNEVSEEHLLTDIANQVRLRKVRGLLGYPVVTPYDVYCSYRDQNERVGAKIVEMPVDSFLSKVSEPTAGEVQAVLRQVPGRAARPRARDARVQDSAAGPARDPLARRQRPGQRLRDKVTEAELRSYLRESQVRVRGSLGISRGSVRRPTRAHAAHRSDVPRSPRDAGSETRRGESSGRDPRQVHADQGSRDDPVCRQVPRRAR